MKRLFIGIKIPSDENLVRFVHTLNNQLKNENIKWVDVQNLHLTLRFLGDTEESILPGIIKNLKHISVPEFELILEKFGIFGSVKQPRVLWIAVKNNETLCLLKQEIDTSLQSVSSIFEPEKQFSPHITLGRPKYAIKQPKLLKELTEKYKETQYLRFQVHSFILFESMLKPQGPVYKKVDEFFILKK